MGGDFGGGKSTFDLLFPRTKDVFDGGYVVNRGGIFLAKNN